LSAAAGPGEERFRGRWIPELWDRELHSRRRRKRSGVSAVCLGPQSNSRLEGPWGSLQELKSKLSFERDAPKKQKETKRKKQAKIAWGL
jgi:hypothetical protein